MKLSSMVKEKKDTLKIDTSVEEEITLKDENVDEPDKDDDLSLKDEIKDEENNDIDDETASEIKKLAAIGNPEKTPIESQEEENKTDDETQAELDAIKALAGI